MAQDDRVVYVGYPLSAKIFNNIFDIFLNLSYCFMCLIVFVFSCYDDIFNYFKIFDIFHVFEQSSYFCVFIFSTCDFYAGRNLL